jgi:hypothetical protein
MTAAEKKAPAKKAPQPVDRAKLKKKLKTLKASREEAKTAKEAGKLERIRSQYRRVTHALRKTAAPKGKKVKAE